MITVKATREGLVGQKTASGWIIDTTTLFVALPSVQALRRWIIITNPLNGKSTKAEVLDIGPWNVNDDYYVFQHATNQPGSVATSTEIRPQAETGTDLFNRPTNGAGIDLGEAVWNALGMTDNGNVSWEFV